MGRLTALGQVQGTGGDSSNGGSTPQGLQGFRLIDLAGVNPDRREEADAAGSVMYAEDTEALFNIAMDRMVAGGCGCAEGVVLGHGMHILSTAGTSWLQAASAWTDIDSTKHVRVEKRTIA
jgi:hypothetical protein